MKGSWLAAWLLFTGLSLRPGHTSSLFSESLDGSGDDDEGSASGDWTGGSSETHILPKKMIPVEEEIIPVVSLGDTKTGMSDDSDITFDSQPVTGQMQPPAEQETRSFLEDKETLAAVISGGVGALVLALVLVGAVVYHLKKKEKANYGVKQHTHCNTMYHKAQTKDEFVTA